MSRLRLFVLSGFWLALFVGTHLPKVPSVFHRTSDKTLHFLAYCGLGLLLMWVRPGSRPWWKHSIGVFVTVAVYGAIDELLQIPVGRICDVQDWLADMLGCALAVVVSGGIYLAFDAKEQPRL